MSASASDEPVGAERSLGALVATATGELSALMHDEIALAKAQLRQDVKRGAVSGGAYTAAGVLLVFSLPMLNFALAYGIQAWSGWHLSVCFLLSFAANVLVAGLFALIGTVFMKKARRGHGPQKAIASAKETAAVLGNVKPHPRSVTPARDAEHPAIEERPTVARSSS
ncbi:phage holin family protein [Streptomyces sulfonofaciens]|nr:phage holin family protein [Streptomyces sulfonofaciens]